MMEVNKRRGFKYLLYFIITTFLSINFGSSHDSRFFEILAGFVILNLIFGVWLFKFKFIPGLILGLIIPYLAIYLAFSIQSIYYSRISDVTIPGLVFSITFLIISIILWEFS